MFMVKKLVDEEKGGMGKILEKECKGLFINVSRFEMDRCFWKKLAEFALNWLTCPTSEVLLNDFQKSLQFKFSDIS